MYFSGSEIDDEDIPTDDEDSVDSWAGNDEISPELILRFVQRCGLIQQTFPVMSLAMKTSWYFSFYINHDGSFVFFAV